MAGLLAAAVAAGCGTPIGTGGRTVICAVEANNPHESSGTPGSIDGKAKFWCDPPGAERLWIRVHLELRAPDGRTPVGVPAEDVLLGANTVATAKKPLVRQAVAPCLSGTYRTVVDAEGRAFGDAEKFDTSRTAGVDCK